MVVKDVLVERIPQSWSIKCKAVAKLLFMSADIMASLCSVHVNNFSKSTRPRDMLVFSRIFDSSYVLSCGHDFKLAV